MIELVASWELGYDTVHRPGREPTWLLLDVGPVVGVVTGSDGWGFDRALAAKLLARCEQALSTPTDDALSTATTAIEAAVVDHERPDGDESTVAGATLVSLEENRFRFAHVGASALLHVSRSGLRRLSAGHRLGYQVAEQEGMEHADEHPLCRIWSDRLDQDHQEWDTGGGIINEGDLLLVVTPDLAWDLQLGKVDLPAERAAPPDIASEIVARFPPERDSDGGSTAIVARFN